LQKVLHLNIHKYNSLSLKQEKIKKKTNKKSEECKSQINLNLTNQNLAKVKQPVTFTLNLRKRWTERQTRNYIKIVRLGGVYLHITRVLSLSLVFHSFPKSFTFLLKLFISLYFQLK